MQTASKELVLNELRSIAGQMALDSGDNGRQIQVRTRALLMVPLNGPRPWGEPVPPAQME